MLLSAQTQSIPLDVTLSPPNGVIGNNEFTISCIRDEVIDDITVIQISRVDNGTNVVLVFYSLATEKNGSWTNTSGDLSLRATFEVMPKPKPYLHLTFNEVRCDDEGVYACMMIGGDITAGIRIYEGDATVELHGEW